MQFTKSDQLNKRLHQLIPGGCHTYAKGDDQFPEGMAPVIKRGKGCRVWDADGNEFIEYGSGLRSVTLGHAYGPVLDAVRDQLDSGSNFLRPSAIEVEAAEALLALLPGADMVKFGKNGSDATSAAIRLARGYTGRDMIAICGSQPFFSVDDWFIGSTAMPGGIPLGTRQLTVKFQYNDIASLERLFDQHPASIAAVILEAEKEIPPEPGFLDAVRRLCTHRGAIFVLDEMITGFRWHNGGAQEFHRIQPDLSTFGKGLGNGFSASALAGRRELMRLGGPCQDKERVFLLSTTHGAETHALAAAIATIRTFRELPVIETLWARGERLKSGIVRATSDAGIADHIPVLGRPCCLVFGSLDEDLRPSQPFRTLLMQELIKRGVLATSLVVNFSHTDNDIDRTIEAFAEAAVVYRRALEDGIGAHLRGRSVQPAIRPYG